MATVDELLAVADTDIGMTDINDVIIIDPVTRQLHIPTTELILGVESDEKAERKYFKCPKSVGNGIDICACNIRINFMNANGEKDYYIVEDAVDDGDFVTFSWVLSRKVTKYIGKVSFVVCFCTSNSVGEIVTEWNTTVGTGNVLEGLEVFENTDDPAVLDVIGRIEELAAQAEAFANNAETAATEAREAAESIKEVGDFMNGIRPPVTIAHNGMCWGVVDGMWQFVDVGTLVGQSKVLVDVINEDFESGDTCLWRTQGGTNHLSIVNDPTGVDNKVLYTSKRWNSIYETFHPNLVLKAKTTYIISLRIYVVDNADGNNFWVNIRKAPEEFSTQPTLTYLDSTTIYHTYEILGTGSNKWTSVSFFITPHEDLDYAIIGIYNMPYTDAGYTFYLDDVIVRKI